MPAGIVLFGGTGYVGKLILAALLRATRWRVVLPVRSAYRAPAVLEAVACACQQLNGAAAPDLAQRLIVLPLAQPGQPLIPPAALRHCRIERVINAAGNVNYFAEAELEEGNIALTRRTLEFTAQIGPVEYVYVSTAFSAGYRECRIEESLHDEPHADPTYYTRTKRVAEGMVAASGLPYLIVRPSVLIGDSRTGLYTGKAYGLYQYLKSFTYFLTDRYYSEVHVVAPEHPFHLLHQDAFAAMFVTLLQTLPPDRVVNMVSAEENLPTARDLYRHFFSRVTHPERVYLYEDIEDVPLAEIPRRQRMFLHVTRVNGQIIGHRWSFNRETVARLEAAFPGAGQTTVESTGRCVDAYVRSSAKCQTYLSRYRSQFSARTIFIPVNR